MAVTEYAGNYSIGETNPSNAVWNSSTAVNTVALLVNNGIQFNSINVTLAQTSTITGGVVTFEGSTDGTNFFPMTGVSPSTLTAVGPTYTLAPSTYATFEFDLIGVLYFQVVLTTAITGSGTVTVGYVTDSNISGLAPTTAATGASSGNAPTIVAINTTSTSVLAANPLRKGLNLVNMSYETISLAFGANAAVLYSGINLGPGGTFWMDATDFTTAAVSAISTLTAEGGYLGVQEFQ
jgi:hypothetical protein